MRLKRYTDYSLRILIYAGLHGDRKVTVDEISESFRTSRNHLVKVVHGLSGKGFLKTVRGKGGGMCLARPAGVIGVGEVIRAMEGNLKIVDCDKPPCPIVPVCKLIGVLASARLAFFKELDRYSIADLIENNEELTRLFG
ncbi:MAG TPA: Rrf2 family transcriptional regulator [Rhodospirillales bacterium]|jgi:Rrf2 family nitric oxide-sensitive transcriptional repressor|nr:Rrf2 family transcriptional regulator [Rhodospirillales bacterium]